MHNKLIVNKIVVSNILHHRLENIYDDIANLYNEYLSDEIKEIGFFISHVPDDGVCMHLNYDGGYIAPLSIINKYLFEDENTIITLDVLMRLSI